MTHTPDHLLQKALTEIEHVDFTIDRGRHSPAHTLGIVQACIELTLETNQPRAQRI